MLQRFYWKLCFSQFSENGVQMDLNSHFFKLGFLIMDVQARAQLCGKNSFTSFS